MNRKLLIQSIGFVIIALVLLPSIAGAASAAVKPSPKPSPKPTPTDQILDVVTDIQTMVSTVLTNLAELQTDVTSILTNQNTLQTDVSNIMTDQDAIQTDVTTIKETTGIIDDKLDAMGSGGTTPPEPIGYEYYTTVMPSKFLNVDDHGEQAVSPIHYWIGFSNYGDNLATVSYTIYETTNIVTDGSGNARSDMSPYESATITLNGKQSKSHRIQIEEDSAWTPELSNTVLRFPILTYKITSNSKFVAPRLLILDNTGQTLDEYSPGDFQRVEIYS